MASIRLESIRKQFDSLTIIENLSLEIEDGSFVVLVGPSGCGKTTLLRIIAGLEQADGGNVLIDGMNVSRLKAANRELAMVFQSYALYPHMNVRDNMAFCLENARVGKEAIRQRVGEAADMLQIDRLLERKPRQLSGGQRQRVAIGRAIVRHPKAFLFDEPLSNLDAELRVSMRVEISKLYKKLNATMIYVTHDQVEAMTLANKIVIMRQGNIEQVGKPLDLYNRPANLFVAGFIGAPRMNFLDLEVAETTPEGFSADIPGVGSVSFPLRIGASKGEKLTLGIRPEHVALAENEDRGIRFRINLAEQLGMETYLYGSLRNDENFIIHWSGQFDQGSREKLAVGFPADKIHLFDPKTEKRLPATLANQ